jgi:hypothetical protein
MNGDVMRRIFFVLSIVITLAGLFSKPCFAVQSAEYYPVVEGSIYVYDKELYVMTGETRQFGQYTGRLMMNASCLCDFSIFIYSGPDGIIGLGLHHNSSGAVIDLSANPIIMANPNMEVGDTVTSTIPAAALGAATDTQVTVTLQSSTDTVTVPAGTFTNTLRIRIVFNEDEGSYTETIWLAKGIGVVQMYRNYAETLGCFYTCGTQGCSNENPATEAEKYVKLRSFIKGKTTVVIPLP